MRFLHGGVFEVMADAKGSMRQIKADLINLLYLFISLFSIHKLSQKGEKSVVKKQDEMYLINLLQTVSSECAHS